MDIYFMDRHSVDKVGIKKANLKSYPDRYPVGWLMSRIKNRAFVCSLKKITSDSDCIHCFNIRARLNDYRVLESIKDNAKSSSKPTPAYQPNHAT